MISVSRLKSHDRHVKQDDAFNTTWWPVLSIDKCCQVTNLSIETTDHHVLLKASWLLKVSDLNVTTLQLGNYAESTLHDFIIDVIDK